MLSHHRESDSSIPHVRMGFRIDLFVMSLFYSPVWDLLFISRDILLTFGFSYRLLALVFRFIWLLQVDLLSGCSPCHFTSCFTEIGVLFKIN